MPGKPFTIAEKLQGFVAKWKGYGGNERQGAQPFLYNLLDIYEVEYIPGAVFEQHPVRMRAPSKHEGQDLFFPVEEQMEFAAQSMDMYIPKICVWEMKGPGEELSKHHNQILGYWAKMRPRYMVLCNFADFWIYDTDEENGQNVPKFRFTIADLPAHWQALLFLRGEESHFPQRAERVTREMASRVAKRASEILGSREKPAGESTGNEAAARPS